MNDKPTNLEEKWAAAEAAAETGQHAPEDIELLEEVDETTAQLQEQVADLTDRLLRQQADLANYRRRVERDREEQTDEARRDLLRGLLPVIDDFERALGTETDNFAAYREGVELIRKSLDEFLAAAGVERLHPHGEAFDPYMHQAVEHSETDAVPEDHVASVHQAGYSHAGKLLRPAMVGVARPPAASDSDDRDNG